MQHKRIASPERRAIPALFLGISAAIAIAVLAARNLYDDEIASLPIITGSAQSILHFSSASDVHPPGMYLFAHIALHVLPSFRWMNLMPTAVLYAGLCVFVVNVAPLFRNSASKALFLLLATLHPQLLLWGTSYRWYSWWTGIALITLTVALQPRREAPLLSIPRSVSLGLLLAVLFYLNYITILFALCLATSMVIRYRRQPTSRLARTALITTATFVVISAPQLRVFFRTYAIHGSGQRSSLIGSFARLAIATLASEAYVPWHPLAIVTATLLLVLLAAALYLHRRTSTPADEAHIALTSITAFAILFFVLVALSGLGGKPRSGLLLVPVLAVVLAQAANRVPARVQYAAVLLIAEWSAVGFEHMLTRTALAKSEMIDRPEQVTAFVRASSAGGCAVIVTYDQALAFAVSHPALPRTLLVSPFPQPIADSETTLPADCTRITLYIVHAYVGGNANWAASINSKLDSAAQLIAQPQTASFSFDPDAEHKRALTRLPGFGADLESAARLPDYRYIVTAGPITPSALPQLLSRLPNVCAGHCSNPPVPQITD